MAKLNAPLFSFRASGAIAKALVYFGWKGLNVVRSYVVPTNPKSQAQRDQRGYLTAAVIAIHAAQALAENALDAADQIAYSLYGSIFATPRTWFNTIVKDMVDCQVAGELKAVLCNGLVVNTTPLELTFTGKLYSPIDADGKLYWGLTKTNMPYSKAANAAIGAITVTTDATVKGTKYFLQWKADPGSIIDGMHSGIYTKVST